MRDRFNTIKNYLSKWENGTDEELLLEVCEKLYQLQIDFDQLEGNALPLMDNRINEIEENVK